jgi:hypothetical protein
VSYERPRDSRPRRAAIARLDAKFLVKRLLDNRQTGARAILGMAFANWIFTVLVALPFGLEWFKWLVYWLAFWCTLYTTSVAFSDWDDRE